MIRWLSITALVALAAGNASAVPITSIHLTFVDSSGNALDGTLTASLSLWTRPYGSNAFGCCAPLGPPVLVNDQLSLGIGSDFDVVLPQSVIDSHAAWEAVIADGDPLKGGWPVPGLDWVGHIPFAAVHVPDLDAWCSPAVGGDMNKILALARRGGPPGGASCTFAQKIANLEARNAGAALLVNNLPGAGAAGIGLFGFEPTIPVVSLSYEVGEQLLAIMNSTGADNIQELAYIDFAARWDPDPPAPQPVPEPGTLGLLAFATGLVGFSRARRLSA